MKYASVGVNELNSKIEGYVKALAEETDAVRQFGAFGGPRKNLITLPS